MSGWQKKKEIALSRGTCPHHLSTPLTNGRCNVCDANQARRLQRAALRNVCPNHNTVTLVEGSCSQCVENYEKRRDRLALEQKCAKHSATRIDGICPICAEIKQEKIKKSLENGTCKRHPDLPLQLDGSCGECASYRIKLKSEKRCLQHPSISVANASCPVCNANYLESKNLALSTGKCMIHPNKDAVTGVMCFDCWCASIAGDALGSKKLKEVIKKSFTENPYC